MDQPKFRSLDFETIGQLGCDLAFRDLVEAAHIFSPLLSEFFTPQ